MIFNYSARKLGDSDVAYLSAAHFKLKAEEKKKGNNGLTSRIGIMLTNTGSTAWSGVIKIELPSIGDNPRFFLPAFMYGRNRGEQPHNVPNEYPRMRKSMGRPSAPYWYVRSDRLSHPVALIYDKGRVRGLHAQPYFVNKKSEFRQYAGFYCSIDGVVGYTLGYENAPWHFVKSKLVEDRKPLGDNCFTLEANETVEFDIYVYEYPAESELGINLAIEDTYSFYHQPPRKGSSIQQAAADIAKAIVKYAWNEDVRQYSGFVFDDGEFTRSPLYSLTWTNGLSVAVPMLMASLRLDNAEMKQQALSFIDNAVNHSMNTASGLPFGASDGKSWSNVGWWFDGMHTRGHSGYLTGQACYYILKAYEYEKLVGIEHLDWLAFAGKIIVEAESEKNSSHEYPVVFSEITGAGLEYDAFGGVWCLAASAYYTYLLHKENVASNSAMDLTEGLLKSERHYYKAFVSKMECYGSPLDTSKAADSEGILAYIRAVRYLYEITRDETFLSHMRDAFCYEFSFKFGYNSPIKIPPLSKLNWSSSGGSVTSVCNPHIHPMSSSIIDEMLFYLEHRDDCYIRSRLNDTIGWSCQTYNRYDREFDFGFKGWLSERFCYSEGLLTERYPDGSPASTWFCLMPWAAGSIVEGLCGKIWDAIEGE